MMPALVAGAALVLAAAAASTSAALAKDGVLAWERWDVNSTRDPVSVSYVWDANYGGIEFARNRRPSCASSGRSAASTGVPRPSTCSTRTGGSRPRQPWGEGRPRARAFSPGSTQAGAELILGHRRPVSPGSSGSTRCCLSGRGTGIRG